MSITSERIEASDAGALAQITWRLEAYAGHWLTEADLSSVTRWMDDNRLVRATAQSPVIVRGGRITYGQDQSPETVRCAQRRIKRMNAPLLTPPPRVWQPTFSRAGRRRVQAVMREHEWCSAFDGICVDCSTTSVGDDGRLRCHRDDAAPWPCPPVGEALRKFWHPLPAEPEPQRTVRMLGDCLDPAANAAVFGSPS